MKYLINKMQCIILSQQMRWLDGKVVCFHFKGQGSNLTSGVCVINNGRLTDHSPI